MKPGVDGGQEGGSCSRRRELLQLRLAGGKEWDRRSTSGAV